MNIEKEIEYYKNNRTKLTINKKHLIEMYGLTGYKHISKHTLPKKYKPFKTYKQNVWKLTEKQPLHLLENFERRGFTDYHVDHIVSIFKAYKLGWTIEQCADIANLQMLPFKENMKKGTK